MPKLSDLFGEKSGLPKGLQSSVEALDDMLKDSSEKFAVLSGPLKDLHELIKSNVEQTKEQLKQEKISGKVATAALKRQIKLINELNKSIGDETDQRLIGIEELAKFDVEIGEVNKQLLEESKLLAKGNAALSEKLKLEEAAAEAEKAAIEAAEKRAKMEERATEVYESAGSKLAGLGDALDQTTVDARGVGAALVASSAQWRKAAALRMGLRTGEGGGLTRKGKAGVFAGGLIAGAIGTAMAIANKQRKALVVAATREFQYGAVATINEGRRQAEVGLNRVRQAARQFGQDTEEAEAAFGKLAAETGASWDDSAKAVSRLAALSLSGLGGVSELGDQVIEMSNSLGISTSKAATIMEDVALTAKAMNREMGGPGAVMQMDDFFKTTMRLAEGLDSLSVSHKGLARAMTVSAKVGKDLGLSYTRRIKAAEGLTRALTTNYDEGFATLHVQEDLAAAMRSAKFGQEAANIQDMLSRGVIHAGQAARMLKEVGATTDEGVVNERMRRSALAIVQGNAAIAESMLGELSVDQVRILEDIGRKMESGDMTLERAMSTISDADRTALRTMQKEVGRQQALTAGNLMSATLDDLMTSLSGTFETTLNLIVDALTSIRDSIEWWKAQWPAIARAIGAPFKAFDKVGKFFGLSKTEKEKRIAEEADLGRSRLSLRVAELAGKGTTLEELREDPKKAIEMLAKDKNLQRKFRERGRIDSTIETAITETLGATEGAKLLSKLRPAAAAAAAAPGGPTTVTATHKPNGDMVVKAHAQTAGKLNSTRADETRSRDRVK